MKRLIGASLAAMLMVGLVASTAFAASPNKLRVELGPPADATITGVKSATLDVDAGGYAALYVSSKAPFGKPLAGVDFGFDADGSIAGGAPRLSIPVDSDDAGSGWDLFAFIDVNSCAGNGFVSTTSATCGVYIGSEFFANWDLLAAAHPTWRMASDTMPFVIADQAGTYVLSDIDLN